MRAQPTAAPGVVTEPPRAAGTAGQIIVRVAVLAMLGLYVVLAGPTLASAVGGLSQAAPGWVATGLVATVASATAFGLLRSTMLTAAGPRLSAARTVAISYGAGAIQRTLPAGAVFSNAYAFRSLRRAGAPVAAVTWSIAATGLVSALCLATLGLVGAGLTGSDSLTTILQMLALAALVAGLAQVRRHPEVLGHVGRALLNRLNRIRRRPTETGQTRLTEILDDLRSVRPSPRTWGKAVLFASANWVLDIACLAACCVALGVDVGPATVILTFVAGAAAGSLLPMPGGIGAVETAMTLSLALGGVAAAPALAAVLLHRLLSTGSMLVIGWSLIAAERLRPTEAPKPIGGPLALAA